MTARICPTTTESIFLCKVLFFVETTAEVAAAASNDLL